MVPILADSNRWLMGGSFPKLKNTAVSY